MAFKEERILDKATFRSTFQPKFAVQVTRQFLSRHAVTKHPYEVLHFVLNFDNLPSDDIMDESVELYQRCVGAADGFRYKHLQAFSSKDRTGTPTAWDQRCVQLTTLTWQLTLWFDTPGDGVGRKRIRKPVSGTTLAGIEAADGSFHNAPATTSVDVTTGIATLPANKTHNITGISQAAQAVVTLGAHTITVADGSVYFSSVAGMTEINTLRGNIVSVTGTTITVDIDTTGFTAYSSGGFATTNPQTGEYLTAGFEYDIPVAFMGDIDPISYDEYEILSVPLRLEELLDP